MAKRAAIFDCDGVLVDTEPLYFALNRDFIRSRGGDFDFAYYSHFIGLSSDLMWGELKEKFHLAESVETLIAMEKQRKKALLSAQNLPPMDKIPELLTKLAAHEIPCAVASSGRRENVELILAASGLRRYFTAVITGEDVVRGKPAPDIFLKAAQALGVAPCDCAVIEDSQNGVRAAKAAGMYCIGYQNPHSGQQDLSAADVRISRFADPQIMQSAFLFTA